MRIVAIKFLLISLLFTFLPVLTSAEEWPKNNQVITNYWKQDLNLSFDSGKVIAGPKADGWTIEPIDGQDFVRLQSGQGTDKYLTAKKDGQLTVRRVPPTNKTSWWTVEAVPNTAAYRIRHHLNDARYLNIEAGPLSVSDIHFGAWSGWWLLQPASAIAAVPNPSKPPKWPGEARALQNYWKRDLNLSANDGQAAVMTDASGWIVEPITGQDAVRLRSDQGEQGYLTLKWGQAIISAVPSSDEDSWWVAEPVANYGAYRFRHHLNDSFYLNVENGPLEVSNIHQGALSSWWLFQPISAAGVVPPINGAPVWSNDTTPLRNFWKRDLHIANTAGEATVVSDENGWVIEPVDGQNAVRLRSSKSGQDYLTVANGKVYVEPSPLSEQASWWAAQPVANTNAHRLRHFLSDTHYLNIEQGPLAVSDIHSGAWSGWWLLQPALAAVVPETNEVSVWPEDPQALKSYWKRDLHLSDANGDASAVPDATGWGFEQVDGQNAVRLRSDRGTKGLLMLDNGRVTVVPTSPNDMVAWWVAERVANTDAYRFRHFLFKDRYLNIEQGPLLTSAINSGAWSSWWLIEAAPPVPIDANRMSSAKPTPNEAAVLDMFGMWEPELPILLQAVKTMLGETSDQADIASLLDQVVNDSGARIAFMPFVIEAGYQALETETPDTAQAAFRERFRWYYAREQQRKAQGTLIQWLDFTKQSYQGILSTIPNPTVEVGSSGTIIVENPSTTETSNTLVAPADPEAALALVNNSAAGQELLIVVDTTTPIGDPEPFKMPTLSVLTDTGPKLSNFRPNEDNPLLLGAKGIEALGILLQPTILRNEAFNLDLHLVDDLKLKAAVERPTILEQALNRLGFGAGAGITIATLGGGPVLFREAKTFKFTKTMNAKIRGKDIAAVEKQARPAVKQALQKNADDLGKLGAKAAKAAQTKASAKLTGQILKSLGPTIGRLGGAVAMMIPALVDVAMAIAEAIETENFDRGIKRTAIGPLKLPDLDMLLRPSHQDDAGLCYKWCAGDGESAFGTECLSACPAPHVDPGNARNCGPITKPSYGRGVGTPLTCPPEKDSDGALCYDQCRAGYDGVGPACWKQCPAGFADDGAICRKNVQIQTKASYGRGGGTPLVCREGTEMWGGICYQACREGFNGVGPVCWNFPQSYGRGAGEPISACRPGEEKNGALCYPKCSSGFEGKGPMCWASCPDGFVDDGLTCRKPEQLLAKDSYVRDAGNPVTVCPEGKVEQRGACYDPCETGTEGIGTICWESCPDGYTDAGGICHIDLVARVSRSRGVGLPSSSVEQCVAIEDRNLNRLTVFGYVAKLMVGDPADSGKLRF